MSAYRLYRCAEPGRFSITLAHGWPQQESHGLYESQHLLAPVTLRPLAQARFLSKARRWLAEYAGSFDVFHGLQAFHLTVRPAFEAQKLGLPAVVKVAAHEFDLADKADWKSLLGLARRRRRMIGRIGAVIAISRLIAEELRQYGLPDSKIVQIPNGVDTDAFRPVPDSAQRTALRQRFGWKDAPTVLFVGQIISRKRPHLLVEAVGLLKRKVPDCQLVLVGPVNEPQYHRMILARATELGLNDRIIWAPFNDQVADFYRAADLFSLPSASEGMSNALLEAMACGLPSVVTPISGMVDLIRNGTEGAHVEPVAEHLAEVIGQYLASPRTARAHGAGARQRIEQSFSATVVLDAHEQLFRRLMAGKDAAS